jgi:hypothetical protein
MLKKFTRNNVTLVAIILFVIIFIIIQIIKPSFLYKNDGSLREFGVGYKNKTIVPMWLLSIILGKIRIKGYVWMRLSESYQNVNFCQINFIINKLFCIFIQ